MFFKGTLEAIYLSGTIIFQEATCSDLGFWRVLCFFSNKHLQSTSHSKGFELICKSSCSQWFDDLPFYCVFAEQDLYQGDIINTNYDTFFISDIHILKVVWYMTTSFPGIDFFYDSVIISWEHFKRFISQWQCVYFTTLVATINHNKWSVIDWRVYLRKPIVVLPALLKVPVDSMDLIALIFVWKVLFWIVTRKLPYGRFSLNDFSPGLRLGFGLGLVLGEIFRGAISQRSIFHVPC